MRCVDRKGNEIGENAAQGRVLKALYETAAGRILLGILVKPFVSKAGGFLLNQPVSKAAIAPFIKKNHIDMTDYEVVKEIEVLREFAAGIRADLRRYIDKNPMDNFAVNLKEEVEKIYLNVYELDNLKAAYIVRGKLQMVNETLKTLS